MKKFRDFDYSQIKKCSSCEYFKHCKGGCHGMALEYYGTIYEPDPRCPNIKNEN